MVTNWCRFFSTCELDYGYTIKPSKHCVTPNTSVPSTTITTEDQLNKSVPYIPMTSNNSQCLPIDTQIISPSYNNLNCQSNMLEMPLESIYNMRPSNSFASAAAGSASSIFIDDNNVDQSHKNQNHYSKTTTPIPETMSTPPELLKVLHFCI